MDNKQAKVLTGLWFWVFISNVKLCFREANKNCAFDAALTVESGYLTLLYDSVLYQ